MNTCSILTPPIKFDDTDDTIRKKEKSKAQLLLGLLRNIEKQDNIKNVEAKFENDLKTHKIQNQEQEALSILLDYQLLLSHGGGLFGGQVSRAESLLSSTSSSSGKNDDASSTLNRNNKKQKKAGAGRGLITDINAVRKAIFLVDSDSASTEISGGSSNQKHSEENLWLASLGRIMGIGKNKNIIPSYGFSQHQSDNKNIDRDQSKECDLNEPIISFAILEVAAECITAMCDHTKQSLANSALPANMQFCAKTEFEILSVVATKWLDCLSNKISYCLYYNDPKRTYFGLVPSLANKSAQNKTFSPLSNIASSAASACLRAAASIITLLGTRLSRSTHIIAQLQSISWAAIGSGILTSENEIFTHPNVMTSAAMLTSALPLTGNTGNLIQLSSNKNSQNNSHGHFNSNQNQNNMTATQPPSKLWSDAVTTTTNALRLLLYSSYKYKTVSFTPLTKAQEEQADSDTWLRNLPTFATSQQERVAAINVRIDGLFQVLENLLNMKGYARTIVADDIAVNCRLPLSCILQLCELSIKFGLGIESKYLSSSKNHTIRDSIAENGLLLSSSSILNLANKIRSKGYDLLHCIMSLAGSSATGLLLTHGKWIAELIYYGISTTCSIGVQSFFHRVSLKQQQQWLNNSIILRRKAIESMKLSCLFLGSSFASLPIIGKSAVMIAACLLEQVNVAATSSIDSENSNYNQQWSGYTEKMTLVTSALEAISSFISIGAGYIHGTIRSTLESTILSMISILLPSNSGTSDIPTILEAVPVKVALLKVSTNAVNAPWQDGGLSTLLSQLRQLSDVLRYDRDPDVITAAYSAMSVCDMIMTPRSIPLSISCSRDLKDDLHGLSSQLTSDNNNPSKIKKQKKEKKKSLTRTNDLDKEKISSESNTLLEKMGMNISKQEKVKEEIISNEKVESVSTIKNHINEPKITTNDRNNLRKEICEDHVNITTGAKRKRSDDDVKRNATENETEVEDSSMIKRDKTHKDILHEENEKRIINDIIDSKYETSDVTSSHLKNENAYEGNIVEDKKNVAGNNDNDRENRIFCDETSYNSSDDASDDESASSLPDIVDSDSD